MLESLRLRLQGRITLSQLLYFLVSSNSNSTWSRVSSGSSRCVGLLTTCQMLEWQPIYPLSNRQPEDTSTKQTHGMHLCRLSLSTVLLTSFSLKGHLMDDLNLEKAHSPSVALTRESLTSESNSWLSSKVVFSCDEGLNATDGFKSRASSICKKAWVRAETSCRNSFCDLEAVRMSERKS